MAKAAATILAVLLWWCAILQFASSPADAISLLDSVQPFYDVTEKFLDFIQPYDKSILLNDVLSVLLNGTIKASNSSQSNDWQAILSRYWQNMTGYIILVCIGLLLIVLVPAAGLITCCCRCCCHKCGGTGRHMERRGSSCRRGLYGVLLVLLTTAMLLGVVLAFISNHLVRQQMDYTQGDTVLANFSDTLSDMGDLLAEIPVRAKGNSASAMATLVAAVLPATNVSMVRLRNTLGSSSKADTALVTTMAAMLQLGLATDYSGSYVDLHANYSSNVANLDTMLAMLRSNLSRVDVDCPFNAIQSDCDLIASRLPGLRVTQSASSTGLQNVTELSRLLRTVNRTELVGKLTDMQTKLDNVSNVAIDYMKSYVYEVQSNLNSSSELQKIWSSVENLFGSLGGLLSNSSFSVNSTVVDPITQRSQRLEVVVANLDLIRYAIYLAIAILASLVIMLWLTGVIYGFSGEPPFEDARCCNRGVGANLLMTGTITCFISYALLFIVILALFLAGGLTDTEICRYLTGRAGTSGYKQLDNNLNQVLRTTSPGLSQYSLNLVSGLLDGCSSGNASITAALNIESLVRASNIDTLVKDFINRTNVQLQNHRSELVSGVALNINLTYFESVAMMASAQVLLPFITELQKPMVAGSDSVFAAIQNISLTASKVEDKDKFVALVAYLDKTVKTADQLMQSQLISIGGLSTSLQQLNASAVGSTLRLQQSHDSIQTVYNVEQAINEAMSNLSSQLQVVIRITVQRVIGAAADCLAVNQKVTALIRAPCVTFLRPFNGFWAGMGVFLICLLPCLVLTVRLTNLYRKTQKHQDSYVDGDYKNATYQEFYRISVTAPPLKSSKSK